MEFCINLANSFVDFGQMRASASNFAKDWIEVGRKFRFFMNIVHGQCYLMLHKPSKHKKTLQNFKFLYFKSNIILSRPNYRCFPPKNYLTHKLLNFTPKKYTPRENSHQFPSNFHRNFIIQNSIK